jgi:hypothetical protein
MRTTLNIDDDLYRRAKTEAARVGTTVTALLEDALRARLQRAETAVEAPAVRLTTVGGNGVRPGIDLDDSAALLDAMDGG